MIDSFLPTTSPRYFENQERAYAKGLEPCFICGRGVTNPVYWAQTYSGALICTEQYAERRDRERFDGAVGDSGCFVIGPECYRKLTPEQKAIVTKIPHR